MPNPTKQDRVGAAYDKVARYFHTSDTQAARRETIIRAVSAAVPDVWNIFTSDEIEELKWSVENELFWFGDLYVHEVEGTHSIWVADPTGESDTLIMDGIASPDLARCVCAGLRLVRALPQTGATQ